MTLYDNLRQLMAAYEVPLAWEGEGGKKVRMSQLGEEATVLELSCGGGGGGGVVAWRKGAWFVAYHVVRSVADGRLAVAGVVRVWAPRGK